MKNILWFKDISEEDLGIVGGKGLNLGIMYNLKLPVPPGFVVTAQAYKKFLEETGLDKKIYPLLKNLDIQDTDKLEKTAKHVQELILDKEVPEDIAEEIKYSYDNISIDLDIFKKASKSALDIIKAGRDIPWVAVRSSATAEDLPSISENEHVLVKINDKTYFRTIKEIYSLVGDGSNHEIEIPAMKDNKIQWIKVGSLYKHKIKEEDKLYKITTETGREITVAPNHTLIVLDEDTLTPKNVKSIKLLKGNEKLPAINKLPILDLKQKNIDILDYITGDDIVEENGLLKIKNKSTNWKIQYGLLRKINLTKDFAYFLGVYCAEGCTYKDNEIIITNADNEIMNRIIRFISSMRLYNNQKINKYSLRFHNKAFTRFLKNTIGDQSKNKKGKGEGCRNKRVPEFIFGWNKELIGEFLKGCFDGDGYCGKNAIEYYSTSKMLTSGIIKLLEMLEIEWYLREKNNKFNIIIKPCSFDNFSKFIGFECDYKKDKLNKLIKEFNERKNHPEFLNNINISSKLSKLLRNNIENSLPKRMIIASFCPTCSSKINKSSKYLEKERFYCDRCYKAFYENNVTKKEIEQYVYYDSKGRFLKNKTPWNKGSLSKRYGIKHFKRILEKNNIQFGSLNDSVKWDQIKEIKEVDCNGYVYDFCVPDVENFAAGIGGIITHNTASFAGQQETFLNIKGKDNIIRAVQRCWASLFTARAIYYRTKNKFPHDQVLIAVIIQKMIDSETSGVIFSINPATNNKNEIIIEAGFGLGEAIVGGQIIPDIYIVDKTNYDILSKKVSVQRWMYARDEMLRRTNKVILTEIKGGEQKLKDELIIKLAEIAKKLEKHYGKAQDIEYAVEHGRIYIVQTRAVTTEKKVKEARLHKEIKAISILEGIGASPGIGSGTVKIVYNIEDLNKIQTGDVLVTVMTNPDYVVAMQKASAIVTDEGALTCFGGNTNVLTNKGFKTMEETHDLIKNGEELLIFSYNYKEKKPCWKKLINSGKRLRWGIKVSVSQKGILNHNTIDITPDHKMFTFNNRNLIKKELRDILDKQEYLCLVEKLPNLFISKNKDKEAYLLGALVSDGYVKINYQKTTGNPRSGIIAFTQKNIQPKEEFISYVKQCFNETFNENFSREITKYSHGQLRGRLIEGYASDFMCYKLEPAMQLTQIIQNLDSWALTLNETASFNFLAGLVDGDGCFCNNRLHIYISKKNVLQTTILACLRLGIVPQVTKNRNIHHIQILERMDEILEYTKRVKGIVHKKLLGNKLFSAKQILGNIINEVNWGGKIKPYVKNNLMIDSNKINDRIIPMLKLKNKEILAGKIKEILNSSIRMNRVKKIQDLGNIMVYNLEVEANNELDHNYIIFTEKYTPLLVSNSHAAIVSREMGIPCVTGTEKATKIFKDGDTITVDGTNGKVYKGRPELEQQEIKKIDYPYRETKTKIYMNLGEPDKIDEYKELYFDGIGLMRLEFLIANKIGEHPNFLIRTGQQRKYIDELYEGIKKIALNVDGKPVIVRFSDFKTNEYKDLRGGEEFEPHEENPMIGWRGVSRYVSEEFKDAFKLECLAIKKVREEFKNVYVMLPFVRNVDEVKKCIEIMKESGLERNHDFKIFLMAEVPSMALIPEEFAELDIDGVSIGSNDLTQLCLGVDRDSSRLGRMGYFDERNHAVLKAIHNIIQEFISKGKTVSLCGQSASEYREIVEFLVKEKITSVSVNPDVVNKTRFDIYDIEQGGE